MYMIRLFTIRAKKIADERRKASIDFYESMYYEVCSTHEKGNDLLKDALKEQDCRDTGMFSRN